MYLTQPQVNEVFNPWIYPELAAQILFLGGLPLETNKSDLVAFLSLFSEVIWLSMGLDKETGVFKGYAYTILVDQLKAESLLQKKTLDFMGVKVGVLRWKASCDYINDKDSNLKKKIFIKGLEPTVDDSDLYVYFSKFGTVEFAEVRRDHLTKQSRRIGFILFENETSASNCLAKKNHYLKNRKIFCKACKSKRDKELLHEEYQKKTSDDSSDALSKAQSCSTATLSSDKSTILGTQVINKSALRTLHQPSLIDLSSAISSPQDSLSVLGGHLIRKIDSLDPKVMAEDCLTFPQLGFCANRSDNSVSTQTSTECMSTPKSQKSKAKLNKLVFSEPFVPTAITDKQLTNKPIQIQYFTLPGSY